MRQALRGVTLSVGALLFWFAPSARATTLAQELANLGLYSSAYVAVVNPNTAPVVPTTVSVLAICDDFTTDVNTVDTPWQVATTSMTQLQGEATPNQTVLYDRASTSKQTTDYTVAAYLSTEILQAMEQGNTAYQATLSEALWDVFDQNAFTSGTVMTALNAAKTTVTGQHLSPGSFGNTYMVTVTPSSGPATEYMVTSVTAPESSTAAVLAADFAGFGVVVFFLRKRLRRT